MFLPLFHLSVALFDAYTLWYDQNYVNLPIEHKMREKMRDMPFKARYLFLTIWCLVIQTIYFTLAFFNDIIGSNSRAPKSRPIIRIVKDALFSIAFPLALFVAIAFWGIYYYDSELILPEHVRKIFPSWVNHSMHTTIVPFILMELVSSPITYPSKKVGIFLGLVLIISYLGLLASVFMKSGTMVYPVLNVMSVSTKVSFLAIASILGLCLYFVCEFMSSLANPKESGKSASKPTGKKKSKRT